MDDRTIEGTPVRPHRCCCNGPNRCREYSMIVTRLRFANLRAVRAAEFRFQPGVNLVVGVNGVGKTSMLDALSVCLSAIVKDTNRLRTPLKPFADEDIRIGASVLDVE